jgi:hypothetical protein
MVTAARRIPTVKPKVARAGMTVMRRSKGVKVMEGELGWTFLPACAVNAAALR